MSARAGLALAALLSIGPIACKRGAGTAPAPLLTAQTLPPQLRALVDRAHAHPAVATLEAAGCELALVMSGADYNRFVDLRHGAQMPAQASGSTQQVVYCQSRATPPPDCADVAPIFARVARPAGSFQVFSGSVDPPFAPRCAGQHDKEGRFVGGEGPGYPSSR